MSLAAIQERMIGEEDVFQNTQPDDEIDPDQNNGTMRRINTVGSKPGRISSYRTLEGIQRLPGSRPGYSSLRWPTRLGVS